MNNSVIFNPFRSIIKYRIYLARMICCCVDGFSDWRNKSTILSRFRANTEIDLGLSVLKIIKRLKKTAPKITLYCLAIASPLTGVNKSHGCPREHLQRWWYQWCPISPDLYVASHHSSLMSVSLYQPEKLHKGNLNLLFIHLAELYNSDKDMNKTH